MERPTATLRLRPGREKPVLRRHPWIFSGAIAKMVGQANPGGLVDVISSKGEWLARAYYNPNSQIKARVLTWEEGETIDQTFWQSKLEQAVWARRLLEFEPSTTAYRLVNAESDGLPGLIVDRYEETLVVQILTLGMELQRELILGLLVDSLKPRGIYERSDVQIRGKEGLGEVASLAWGQEPQHDLLVKENDHPFLANVTRGHKTGLYLDQRENRALVCQKRFVAGKEVLNMFAYTGGFGVYAAAAGARAITNVDISADLLAQAEENIRRSRPGRDQDEYIAADAFEILRHFRDEGRQFDVIVLDPPKFARRRREVQAACRGYKDLNWLAMRLLRPNGLLATFSCSGAVAEELFQKVVFGAALDAGKNVQILYRMGQSADHPVLLSFPESAYLKGFLCRVQ